MQFDNTAIDRVPTHCVGSPKLDLEHFIMFASTLLFDYFSWKLLILLDSVMLSLHKTVIFHILSVEAAVSPNLHATYNLKADKEKKNYIKKKNCDEKMSKKFKLK